jgi:hypothetical protein
MPPAARDLGGLITPALLNLGACPLSWAAEIGLRTATAFEPRQSERWGLTSHPRGPRLGTAALVANLLNRAERVQVAESLVYQYDELVWRSGQHA